jgi:hypothetical protein
MVLELKNKDGQKQTSDDITQQSRPRKNSFFDRQDARQKPTQDAAQATSNKN